ncbi:MAG: hypothetical protein H8E85_03055 [Candidatus Marinimicrobia bacterium]|nr:hypothetical protein [Candidatus Neomarinimicrobiota bacterium]
MHKYKQIVYYFLIFSGYLLNAQDESWELLGLEGENIRSIIIDKFNDSTIYVGSYSQYGYANIVYGKIFKSLNKGESWDTLLIGTSVGELLQHPSEPQTIFATLGSAAGTQPGIIKTINGGESWNFLNTAEMWLNWETNVNTIAIDPFCPDTLYAGTGGIFGGYFYRSINGGEEWELLGQDEIIDNNMRKIKIDPINSQNIYLGTSGMNYIFKSSNYGINWEIVWGNIYGTAKAIEIDSQSLNVIYATQSFNSQETPGIIKSNDYGLNWFTITEGIEGLSFSEIIIHPYHSNILFAGSDYYGMYKSVNGGETWFPINTNLPETISIRTSAIDTEGTLLFIASAWGQGLYRSNIILDQDNCIIPGDLNNDGSVNILDIVQTVNCILNNLIIDCADLNNDNLINIEDIILIINIIL